MGKLSVKFFLVLISASLLTGCVTSGTLKRETQAAFAAGAASRDKEILQLQMERDLAKFTLKEERKDFAQKEVANGWTFAPLANETEGTEEIK